MTRQIKDRLVYENHEYYLHQEIIGSFFKKFPEKKTDFNVRCSAMWRGYVATFEIKSNELLITKFDWLTDDEFNMKSMLGEIFPNKLDWYSGLIRIDDFKEDIEPENGIFEYLQIEDGVFKNKLTFNYIELQNFKKIQLEKISLADKNEIINYFFEDDFKRGWYNEKVINECIFENILRFIKRVN